MTSRQIWNAKCDKNAIGSGSRVEVRFSCHSAYLYTLIFVFLIDFLIDFQNNIFRTIF